MTDLTIRTATPADEADWRALWAAFLKFYDASIAPEVTNTTWSRIIDPTSLLTARLAVLNAKAVGFCLHHTHLSTWGIAHDCYLEDLFVAESARSHGIGRALIDDLIAICKERGDARLYWHTNTGNARARALYDSYAPADGHIRYRIRF